MFVLYKDFLLKGLFLGRWEKQKGWTGGRSREEVWKKAPTNNFGNYLFLNFCLVVSTINIF